MEERVSGTDEQHNKKEELEKRKHDENVTATSHEIRRAALQVHVIGIQTGQQSTLITIKIHVIFLTWDDLRFNLQSITF